MELENTLASATTDEYTFYCFIVRKIKDGKYASGRSGTYSCRGSCTTYTY